MWCEYRKLGNYFYLTVFVDSSLMQCICVIQDLVGNNNNSIANCIFCLTKKSNQPQDGSQLQPKHVVERNNVRNTPLFDYILFRSII